MKSGHHCVGCAASFVHTNRYKGNYCPTCRGRWRERWYAHGGEDRTDRRRLRVRSRNRARTVTDSVPDDRPTTPSRGDVYGPELPPYGPNPFDYAPATDFADATAAVERREHAR